MNFTFRFCIFKSENIQKSIFKERTPRQQLKPLQYYERYVDLAVHNDIGFSFSRLTDWSPQEMEEVTIGGLIKW